jgi:MFS family permease
MFVLGDLALLAGWGLVQPIFAVFVVEKVAGATIVTVGIAAAVYWITKAILQLPIANFLDGTPSEKDDFIILVLGLVLVGLSGFAFVLVSQIWQLYLVQFLLAVGFSMYTPAWQGIFSRHLDKSHEATDWSLDNVAISIAAGVTGLISGVLVSWFGYNLVFVLAGLFSLISATVIFLSPKVVFPHRVYRRGKALHDHRPIVSSRQ